MGATGFVVKCSQHSWTNKDKNADSYISVQENNKEQSKDYHVMANYCQIRGLERNVSSEEVKVTLDEGSRESVLFEVRLRTEVLALHHLINFSPWPSYLT